MTRDDVSPTRSAPRRIPPVPDPSPDLADAAMAEESPAESSGQQVDAGGPTRLDHR